MPLRIERFPELSEHIELPSYGEFFCSPIMVNIDGDDAFRHGGELIRNLLERTPLRHDRKYVVVTSQIQFLTPDVSSVRSVFQPRNDWHVDASGLMCDDRMFLLLNETGCNTEFNEDEMVLELDEETLPQSEFVGMLNRMDFGLKPRMLPGNRMATFGPRHVHRAVTPSRPTLRYMWRVTESDKFVPNRFSQDSTNSMVFRHKQGFPNIVQRGNTVTIDCQG